MTTIYLIVAVVFASLCIVLCASAWNYKEIAKKETREAEILKIDLESPFKKYEIRRGKLFGVNAYYVNMILSDDSRAVIKAFDDGDEDYNRRCAEELLEKLNEK